MTVIVMIPSVVMNSENQMKDAVQYCVNTVLNPLCQGSASRNVLTVDQRKSSLWQP
jgi:hypothetical protein